MTLATLVRQVARDVWHDLGWIVLYGVLMSCAAYALVPVVFGFKRGYGMRRE